MRLLALDCISFCGKHSFSYNTRHKSLKQEPFALNFLQISYIHSSHFCSHSNVPLSFPNVEPSVFLEHWNDCKPKSTLGREKNHTSVSRFVTSIVATPEYYRVLSSDLRAPLVTLHFTASLGYTPRGFKLGQKMGLPDTNLGNLLLLAAWNVSWGEIAVFAGYRETNICDFLSLISDFNPLLEKIWLNSRPWKRLVPQSIQNLTLFQIQAAKIYSIPIPQHTYI